MGVVLTNGIEPTIFEEAAGASDPKPGITDVASVYSSSHLTFRRDLIEPLADADWFEVLTPAGKFRMTRADFHANFAEVVNSSSYRDRGQYHYPMIPYKAFRFLVREEKPPTPAADGSVAEEQPGGEAQHGVE